MSFVVGNEGEKEVEEVNVEEAIEEATAVLTRCLEQRSGVRATTAGAMNFFSFVFLRNVFVFFFP